MALVQAGYPLLGFVGNNSYKINTLWSTYMDGWPAQIERLAPLKGPMHGSNSSGASSYFPFSLNLTTSWGLSSLDRITSVSVCCRTSQAIGNMDPEPQELRLMTTRGATLSTLSYGYAYSSELTCSSWEPVPPGFLLAGLMWQEVDYWLSSYTGFSARVGFIYAEPGPGTWNYTGPYRDLVASSPPPAARSYPSYSDDGGGGGGSSVGMIVGIGVGVAAALIITAALISISRRRSRRQQQQWHNAGPYPPAVGVERPMAPEILLAK